MAGAMVLYVLISQAGLVVGNQIASTAAASVRRSTLRVAGAHAALRHHRGDRADRGDAALSRNAAADDIPAVLADLSLATRLTMVTLIPMVALMTVGGPAIRSALFAYRKFGGSMPTTWAWLSPCLRSR